MKEGNIMNAIYARQSIDKKNSMSIEGQIDICKKLAGENAKVYYDKGFSGKNTNRPAFTELINGVKSGEIKKIYVYRLDRFSRSIADFSRIWELLSKHNVEFVSATENFDTSSPMGRAMLNIVQVFAQLERETTAERVKDNYIHRFKLGAWPGGPAPYGFDLIKTVDGGKKISSLIKNDKSEIVKFIFEEYAKSNTSLRSIAKELTNKYIHGPKRDVWDNVTLSRILHSPVYVRANQDIYFHYLALGMQIEQPPEAFDGIHGCNVIGRRDRTKNKYNDLNGQMLTLSEHEGFIESDLWLKVQYKLSSNKQIARASAGKYSWLTGLLKCAKCGYALKINNIKSENKFYLICSGKSNLAVCDCRVSVDLHELENYVATKIQEMLNESPPNEIPVSKSFSEEILNIEQKIERLVNALAESGDIAVSYISRQIELLHKQREELMNKSPSKSIKIKTLDFKSLSFDQKKIITAEFIEKIQIEGKNVNIIWKL